MAEELVGHLEQFGGAPGPAVGHRRLQEVAGTVELVAPAQVVPGELGVLALEPTVQVAVRALGPAIELGGLAGELLHAAGQAAMAVPRHRL